MTSHPGDAPIESSLSETRLFEPPRAFLERTGGALGGSVDAHERLAAAALEDPASYWGKEAARLPWSRPFTSVLEGELPDARWFHGGRLNLADACCDVHVRDGHGDELAILWEGEPEGESGSAG